MIRPNQAFSTPSSPVCGLCAGLLTNMAKTQGLDAIVTYFGCDILVTLASCSNTWCHLYSFLHPALRPSTSITTAKGNTYT